MVLQNQINPHFLYNTLDVIVWMIENEKSGDAVKAVTALARFFRISLSRGKTVIPVSDEVEHVRNYLMIQEMRFKNKFTYQFDVKEETKQLGTVKLILQPLVENAIYHAMEFMDDDGELTVKAYLEGEELVLSVTDNGCGMTQERAAALLRGDFVQTGKGSGVGLRNVQERIQLVFGEKYGLRILSEPDEGTCIEIHIPAISYEEMKEIMSQELGTSEFYELETPVSVFASLFAKVEAVMPKSEAQILTETAAKMESGVPMYYAEGLQ